MQRRTWKPTSFERIVGIAGALALSLFTGLFAWITYPHADQSYGPWLISALFVVLSLGMLWRLVFTPKRGLPTVALMGTSTLFLVAGFYFGYIGLMAENPVKTGFLGGVSLLCLAIGSFNLSRPWRHRDGDG